MLPSVQRPVAETRHRHPDISANDHEWRFLHLVASWLVTSRQSGNVLFRPISTPSWPNTTASPDHALRVTIVYEDEAGYQWRRTDTSQPERTGRDPLLSRSAERH
jgi:hypothetical protein